MKNKNTKDIQNLLNGCKNMIDALDLLTEHYGYDHLTPHVLNAYRQCKQAIKKIDK